MSGVTFKLIDSGPVDLQTRRISALCAALKDSEVVDAELGGMLVRRARAVRGFMQAAEWRLAADTLTGMEKLVADGEHEEVRAAISRAAESLRARARFTGDAA